MMDRKEDAARAVRLGDAGPKDGWLCGGDWDPDLEPQHGAREAVEAYFRDVKVVWGDEEK